MISTWLCHLKELHFKNCAFEGVWDNKFNVYLEIGAMDLDLISINVTRNLQKSGNIKKLCFEVTLRNGGERTTVYYLRGGEKWSPNTLFERKSQASFANKSNSRAAAKKIFSVIYITINRFQKLRVYSPGVFDQMLDIR